MLPASDEICYRIRNDFLFSSEVINVCRFERILPGILYQLTAPGQ